MMNKTIIISLFALVATCTTLTLSFATSGTCSSHGGVDCVAGQDLDGSAICHDGWRDSSERYSDMGMCQAPSCYDSLRIQCANVNFDYYGYFNELVNLKKRFKGDYGAEVLRCVTEDTLNLKSIYDNFIDRLGRCSDYVKFDHDGAFRSACTEIVEICTERATELLFLNFLYSRGIDTTNNCKNNYGEHSTPNGNQCSCESGYEMDSSKSNCIERKLLKRICGQNQYIGENNKCYCSEGFVSNSRGDGCVKSGQEKAPKIIEKKYQQPKICKRNQLLDEIKNKCVVPVIWCKNNFSDNSIYSATEGCQCRKGYELRSEFSGSIPKIINKCVKNISPK